MPYKTIVLSLLQDYHPALHDRLRRQRTLLRIVNAYAAELRARHLIWTEVLRPTRPGSDEGQLSGEALELALADVRASLRHAFSAGATE